ncbi:hypothetical protein EUTSA_v10024822mg [Eutrema salsugineum]|uniref:H/ACA ribonucleoprotein complex non-core subunit NAF1 n=1 Tax=Eutrema salsugineum TaxID=72664 RepID=V4LZY4_EUTSA|nr:hypothetical protein EUTSA_v10024822mg [Eutrema salsugineum]
MYAISNGVVEPAEKESELVVSDNARLMEGETVLLACATMNLDELELKKTEGLAPFIEVALEKVRLTMCDDEKTDGAKGKTSDSSSSEEEDNDEDESDDKDESEEEENKKEKKLDDQMMRMTIDDNDDSDDDDEVNEMIAWSNDEDEDVGLQTKKPIRSKNKLKELPPVPDVDVTLEPHHVTLPVGVVLSVLSTQLVVERMEKHSPLTEGSILWITERRTPLGLVDEIFGPVKCPYYIVRFNSKSEVPEGIIQGTHVSFVADYAQHILNIKELEKKGYDESGDNDEEISEDSDDEKEAENKKKKNRDHGRPTSSYSGEWTENHGTSSLSSNCSDPQRGGPVSNHQPHPQMDGFSPNGGAWRPQSNHQNPYPNLAQMQIPLMAMQNQNQMMFQPQFNGGQMSMPTGPGGLNFFPGQASTPWPAIVGQNCFNQQPFGMGRGIQLPQLPNELNFNLFTSQSFQPQSPMNPQFQPHPQYHMLNHSPQSPMNPQFQMQPQSETRPQSQVPQSPTNPQSPVRPQSQGFSTGQSFERGRGHRGRGRGRGRFGRGRGRGRQQSG